MAAARMKNESVKNVSACDWSNLVGRLTGKISRTIFSLALDINLSGCLKVKFLCSSGRPVWPSRYHLPHLGVLTEVGNVARAWLLISLGELFLFLGPVELKYCHARLGVQLLRLQREQGRG